MVFQTGFEGQTLFRGRTGYAVAHWQKFLQSQGFYQAEIDGIFKAKTLEATTKYQRERRLFRRRDGLVEKTTYDQAAKEGFDLVEGNLLEEIIGLREILVEITRISMSLEITFKGKSTEVTLGNEFLTPEEAHKKIKGYFESYIYGPA
ncbi:hypothetical protein H6F88_13270 [Oculatella sp. FACHB-28]|uniref:peptidoglycan-binding domain-containing protein n=1 Tax=Oculatella sp. FACHB-28 TaxID=2692845 RepID=UPI001684CEC4|nr:hypothetical protein [Oculatella sp. FACHB-28]MBD2056972.1 hypothetical protein [Oculatella sp. FACHB-28]